MGTTIDALLQVAPGLSGWLRRVFCVMGGYVTSTLVLVMYLAYTGVRSGSGGALAVLALVWATSIVLMAAVNVLIDSDFKTPLLALAGVWAVGLVLAAGGQ